MQLCSGSANERSAQAARRQIVISTSLRRVERDRLREAEAALFKHRCGRDARVAGGKDGASAWEVDPTRARQMKSVKADHEKKIEHHLAAAYGDAAPRRQHARRDFLPGRAPRVPPPAVRALLESRGVARNDKTRGLVDVRLEFVAAAREHDEARKLLRALVEFPVLRVAQRGRRQAVGAGDLVVVGDNGVAGDVEAAWHVRIDPAGRKRSVWRSRPPVSFIRTPRLRLFELRDRRDRQAPSFSLSPHGA